MREEGREGALRDELCVVVGDECRGVVARCGHLLRA
jgi:hypothetical protein